MNKENCINNIEQKQEMLLKKVLQDIRSIFVKNNLLFWLDCGLLLGAIRDQKFIPWDCDIDIGMWETDIVKIMNSCRELQKKGFVLNIGRAGIGLTRKGISIPVSILLYRLDKDNAIKEWGNYKVPLFQRRFVDVFFWFFLTPQYKDVNTKRIKGTKNLIRLYLAKAGGKLPSFFKKIATRFEQKLRKKYLSIIPKDYFVKLSTIKFYGMEFNVPSDVENYLCYRYGKDWRIPDKNWVGEKDDGTIFSVDNL
jgi:phosphorylcholine metabolism protein LicD